MITRRLLTFPFTGNHQIQLRSLVIMSPILNTNRREYCTEKCWEEKSYDEHLESLIGNREMVGYGWNGTPCYSDRAAFPFPSIRYKEPSPEIMALKEKERGDWRLLSIQDKKDLYRASYCQTFAEFLYPSSEWMAIVGWALICISSGLWAYMFVNHFIYNPRPKSFRHQYKKAYLRRVLDLHINPITGISSYWDYTTNEWKRGAFSNPPPNPYDEKEGSKQEE